MAPPNLYLKNELMFTIRIEPHTNPFNLPVRGWKAGQYITLDHPAHDKYNLVRVSPDAKCRVRYVSEGTAITFSSKALAALKTPTESLIIEYPKEITNKISLKKYRPSKVAIPMAITVGDSQVKGMAWDISIGGVQFSTNKDLSLEQVVSFDFELFTGRKLDGIKAKVRNRKVELKCIEFPYLYGCEFLDFPQNKKKDIQNFLEYCFNQWIAIKEKEQKRSG